MVEKEEGYQLEIDIEAQSLYDAAGNRFSFEVDSFRKHCFINGLDDIGLSLEDSVAIKAFEKQQKQDSPWLYNAIQ